LFGRDYGIWDISVADVDWKTDDDGGGEGRESWIEEGVSGGESIVVFWVWLMREMEGSNLPRRKNNKTQLLKKIEESFGCGLYEWESEDKRIRSELIKSKVSF